jgi:hypothetical protein
MSRIAIALSGGGYCAALFGLGVLLYLVDAGSIARSPRSLPSPAGR